MDLSLRPTGGALRAALEGLSATLGAHGRLVAIVTALYSLLFMYFQQTLLIDGLTYTPSGPFELHLLPGKWVQITTVPPAPNMPFPLWGTPYVSVTTNYFDLALTPLSLSITLSESLLVALVIALYIDIYGSVGRSFASRPMGVAQTLTLITIFVSCTCEFFEGILAAVEPAAGIISTALPGLLSALDEEFVVFSLVILVVSAIILSARTRGVDLTKRLPKEQLWFVLYTAPFTLFNLLEGIHEGVAAALWATVLVVGVSLVAAKLTRNLQLLVLPAPFLAYFAIGSEELLGQQGFRAVALAVSAMLGVALSAGSEPKKSTVAALLLAASISPLVDPYLVLVPLLMLATSFATQRKKATLKHYLMYQAISWAPTMLGPVAVAYRPTPPIPFMALESQVALYVYLWLTATPISWYLGLRAIFTLMEKAQVTTVEHPKSRASVGVDEALLFVVAGTLAMVSQAALFYANPQAFLVSNYNAPTKSLPITATSLVVFVLGSTLVLAGARKMVAGGRIRRLRAVSHILLDRSKTKVYWIAFTIYLAASLVATGTFAWGSRAPADLPLPSVGVFANGPLLYAPSATIYLTQSFGIVLVPEHILVAVITSMLVATSYKALALISSKPKTKGAGLLGGVFAVALSCPTCTATSIYGLLGLNSAAAGLGLLAAPFVGTAILLATWAAIAATIYYASRKLEPSVEPPTVPYVGGKPEKGDPEVR